jgi:UDP-N-acetylmuramate dehydrogenase
MVEKAALREVMSGLAFSGAWRFDEPLASHTTFKVGGPAGLWIQPDLSCFLSFVPQLLCRARERNIPVFVLGGGANIVVADRGIPGIVLDTGQWTGIKPGPGKEAASARGPAGTELLVFCSGTPVDQAAERAASLGLGGLEFLAGMPGSVGGSVWMNARCYERSVSDVLVETEILTEEGSTERVPVRSSDFGYKKSPFQTRNAVILSAAFALKKRPPAELRACMDEHRRDREAKGHYRYPSAGSAFKNNRAFGKPTGKIIDEAGLRGLSRGGASIAPWHGNLLINTGGATAADIKALLEDVAEQVHRATGFVLENEILFVGF